MKYNALWLVSSVSQAFLNMCFDLEVHILNINDVLLILGIDLFLTKKAEAEWNVEIS